MQPDGRVWAVVGGAVGLASGKVMDRATTWFRGRQSEASRRREDEVVPHGAPVVVAKRLVAPLGVDLTDDQAVRLGLVLHRCLGITYGIAAAILARRGMRPVLAGLATAAVGFVVVDEALNSVLGPPPQAYPVESHLRGVVGHLTFGLSAGLMLAAVGRLLPRR